MLVINGSLQVLPQSVSVEPGEMRLADDQQDALILNLQTVSGIVQIVMPTNNVPDIIEALQTALASSKVPEGLVVTNNIEGAKQMAEVQNEIRK